MRKVTHDGQLTPEVVTSTTSSPGEAKPPQDCQIFKSETNTPYKIKIPKIEIDSCIQQVAIDQNNNIAAPSNVNLAGWYIHSSLPGNEGVSLIDGHASGRYTKGIFYNLHKLEAGDAIEVTSSDGTTQVFRVLTIDEYSLEQSSQELLRKLNSVVRQLTLITCSGSFLSEEETYDKRTIVRAEAM